MTDWQSHVQGISIWMQSLHGIASIEQFGLLGHLHWTFDAVIWLWCDSRSSAPVYFPLYNMFSGI